MKDANESPEPVRDLSTVAPAPVRDATTVISDPAVYPASFGAPAPEAVPGFAVFDLVGEGGMGEVYRARDEELDREVAVKVLRKALADRDPSYAVRFVAEARITARLQHPGIPPVYRVGRLPDGRPFLAMKLIRGRTLAELLEEQGHGSQWVAVFEAICQAVGAAHAAGYIHRDLKPLNVMVGAFGEVQVMDWGLAKLLTSRDREGAGSSPVPVATPSAETDAVAHALTDQTTVPPNPDASTADPREGTRAGAALGTLAYMPPEQARGEIERIDRRADVFALGAILCELLTGRPPLAGVPVAVLELTRQGNFAEAHGRLDGSGADPELIALAKRCLSADAEDRPADASAVAAAVAAFRAESEARAKKAEVEKGQVEVQAAEQRKRQRQFRWAAGVVAAVLLAGVAVSLWQMDRAVAAESKATQNEDTATRNADTANENAQNARLERDAKDTALKAESLAKRQAETKRQEAERNLAFSKVANEILGSVFAGLDPKEIAETGRPLQDVLRENLVKAAKELEGAAIGDPLVVARMQHTLGVSLLGLGEAGLAIEVFQKAWDTFKATLEADHPDTLACMGNLAVGFQQAWKLDLALPLHKETLKRTRAKLGPDHPATLQSMNNLATGYEAAERWNLALPLLVETLELRRAKLPPDHPDTLTSMNNLAAGYKNADKLDLALPLYGAVLELRRAKLPPDHPDTLTSMNNLAAGYLAARKLNLALPLFEETLKLRKATLGPDHPATLTSMYSLALGYQAARKLDLALPLFEETFKLAMDRFGPNHPKTLTFMSTLASGYQAARKLDLALPLFEETLKLRKAKLGPDHPATLTSMNNLAAGYKIADRLDLALPLYEETLRLRKAKFGPDHPATLTSMNNLAAGYRDAGKLDLALPLSEETVRLRKATLGPDHPDTLSSINNLAAAYWSIKRLDKSVPLFEELLPLHEKRFGRQNFDTLRTVANLGVNYKDAGRVAEALPLLEEVYRASKAHPGLRGISTPLLDAYSKAGKAAEAGKLIGELLADARKQFPKDSPQLAGLLAQYGQSLLETSAFAEAELLLRESLTIRENKEPDAWTTFNTQSMLGVALLGQTKYDDAEPLLVKGYEGMKAREKTIPPPGDTRIPEALDRLIALYTARNKPDVVKKYKALRAKYPTPTELAPPPRPAN